MGEYRSPFLESKCPACGKNTLSSSTYVDVCLDEDCGYGYRYPTLYERIQMRKEEDE